jgi:hypothetical protein
VLRHRPILSETSMNDTEIKHIFAALHRAAGATEEMAAAV